jgi:hypothetical protein
MDGLQLLCALKRRSPDLPVMMAHRWRDRIRHGLFLSAVGATSL